MPKWRPRTWPATTPAFCVTRIPSGSPVSGANLEPVTVGGVAVCGGWGNERLAFVTVNASYQADTTIGHASLLLAFRKTSSLWRLLVATRDPVSNRQFVTLLPAFSKMLARDIPAGPVPTPATLRSPENGRFPLPANGARFGDFEWQSSTSEDVVAEIAEFSYHDDARLVLLQRRNPGVPRHVHVSAGQLWTTGGEWAWRVWSITRSGEIAFSEVRTFVHLKNRRHRNLLGSYPGVMAGRRQVGVRLGGLRHSQSVM